MEVVLEGSSPAAITAGIMLLTRARQLGDRLQVAVVGDPDDMVSIPGPAVCYAPVLASCGVGRRYGYGATVVVAGPPGAPVLASVTPHGEFGWFWVDRKGNGAHPATQAYVRLARDPRVQGRKLAKGLRRAIEVLGCSTDPAVLDVLFGAFVPPLTRLAVALRAGRAMSGSMSEPINRFLSGTAEGDPLPPDYDPVLLEQLLRHGGLEWILDGLSTAVRHQAEDWLEDFRTLAGEDGGRDLALLYHLAELGSNLVQLPAHSILPPLGAAEDSVAVGLQNALKAEGDGDASEQLAQVFRFLGGTFVDSAPHIFHVCQAAPPADLIGRWQWFCSQVRLGRRRAEDLWPLIIDPPQ